MQDAPEEPAARRREMADHLEVAELVVFELGLREQCADLIAEIEALEADPGLWDRMVPDSEIPGLI